MVDLKAELSQASSHLQLCESLRKIITLPDDLLNWDLDQQTPHHDLTVWEHTVGVVESAWILADHAKLSEQERFILLMSAFLHDTGKLNPKCHGSKVKNGVKRRTYYGHEERSQAVVREVLPKYNISQSEMERINHLIDCSRRVNPQFSPADQPCGRSDKSISRFILRAGDDWKLAVYLSMSDTAAKRRDQTVNDINLTFHHSLISKILSFNPKKSRAMKPLVNGDEMAEYFGKPAGGWIGVLVERLLAWQIRKPNATRDDAIQYISNFNDKAFWKKCKKEGLL